SFFGSQAEAAIIANRTDYCVGDEVLQCVPPIYPYVQNYREKRRRSLEIKWTEIIFGPISRMKILFKVSPKYHLLACTIEKNFSTMLTAIICYLFDEDRFIRQKKNIITETYRRRSCAQLNEYTSLTTLHSTLNHKDWSMMAVVRDPLERFVSGFANKCLREKVWKKFPDRCNGCQKVSLIPNNN
ncbi:unnamed protein product, partial [Strongylus vulgaris]